MKILLRAGGKGWLEITNDIQILAEGEMGGMCRRLLEWGFAAAVLLALMCSLPARGEGVGTAGARPCPPQASMQSDQWREMWNTEGQATFLDLSSICGDGTRAMAIVRNAKDLPNGRPDFEAAQDEIFVTDCHGNFGLFPPGGDYRNAQLRPIGGLGMVVENAVCRTAGLPRADVSDQEARNYAESVLKTMWLYYNNEWWVYYSIPPNPFTPVPGQNGPIMRYIEARGVSMSVQAQPLTAADRLNGIEWKGRIGITAEAAREYDCATGWGQWVNRPSLMVFDNVKQNGRWTGHYSTALMVPASTKFQRPEPDEVPAPNEAPRSPRLCTVPSDQPPPPQPQKCRPWEVFINGRCMQWRAHPYSGG